MIFKNLNLQSYELNHLTKVCFKFFNKNHECFNNIFATREILDTVAKEMQVQLITLNQSHSSSIVDLDLMKFKKTQFSLEFDGDGLISSRMNIALGIKTADCVPVLLFCKKSGIIAAAHCGWRGVKNNILYNIIHKMKTKGASLIYSIIGPAIQKESYIVKRDFFDLMVQSHGDSKNFFYFEDNCCIKFDLPNFVKHKIISLGANVIYLSKDDTFKLPNKYPSYRYLLSRNKKLGSYILSVIFTQDR